MSALTIGLVGNPNCGKTTLFNALTGARQRVGNWPGVTVERKSGFCQESNTDIEVVDLPGIYSLLMVSDTASIDEEIASNYILNSAPDVIVNILDASNLERSLYLTLQVLEMQVPTIVVLNMMDVARQRQLQINPQLLATRLGCPVVVMEANRNKGIKELKRAIVNYRSPFELDSRLRGKDAVILSEAKDHPIDSPLCGNNTGSSIMPPEIRVAATQLSTIISTNIPSQYQTRTLWLATRLLEGDLFAQQIVGNSVQPQVQSYQAQLKTQLGEEIDILMADARYSFIQTLVAECVIKANTTNKTWTTRIDNIVLNRWLGIPIFLSAMYFMFFFAINIGGAFQDFFDIGSNTLFVQGLGTLLTKLGIPNAITALLANGLGKGINTTVTFIPVIGALFLFLSLLEDSGYMARAAFVVDRGMRALGLPGKSFVPMVIGFGCNVPAVMATRTLEHKRDRILTVMMSPFMSCGARLAIYAVFTAAFFPRGGQNVVFLLYLTGIGMAMLTGLLLRKTVLQGEPSPLVMELPAYHVPRVKTLLLHAWQRLKNFLFRAGKLIIPICVLIGVLGALNLDGTINSGDGDANSLLSAVGRFLTPIFAPMGIHQDNWPATVGLLTGVLAKEVVVGTLNALYTQVGHFSMLAAGGFHFWESMRTALFSIPQNLSQLGSSLGNPVLAQAPVHTLSQSVYGLMYQRFDGQIGAFAYLLFVLLYFPCVSTTAAMLREVHKGWTIFSVLWTTGIAYCVAVLFYQAATFALHPVTSLSWISGILILLMTSVIIAKHFSVTPRLSRGLV